ncbi:MAG: DUF4416 family protein [Leptospira sp.]|nr:DUF4416 family protein [Leptospira sp.]
MKKNKLINRESLTRPPGSSFFIVVSFNETETYYKLKSMGEKKFSESLYESIPMPSWVPEENEKISVYPGSNTRILSFKRRINREELPDIKKSCIQIREKLLSEDETLLIIPGYVTAHNVVIASAFDDYHRVYLFHGVFAEIIYKYEKQRLIVQETAPRFFATKESVYFFSNLRESYVQSIQ